MAISISSDFDGGNIKVLECREASCDLEIRRDQDSDFYQWFYFRVDGAKAVDLELNITNAGGAAYPAGWINYRACVSYDNETWQRTDTNYGDGVLSLRHKATSDTVWFAYFAPFSSERHRALIKQYAALSFVEHTVLGKTLDGRPMDMLTLGEGPLQVWLYARQHPGETMAEWWMEGALEALTGDDAEIVNLRRKATLYVVPNMNPDGSARGHLRTNAVGVNLNREWVTPSLERSPEVWYVLRQMEAKGVDVALDVHGDEAIPHVFMAGFDGIPSLHPKQTALFEAYCEKLRARTKDFQTEAGYPRNPPGQANLTISTNQMAERFGAVAMTLEMPFKDHDDASDPVHGWSPDRSRQLGRDCIDVLAGMIEDLAWRQ
jgi:murein tripeptide amidase MpaA